MDITKTKKVSVLQWNILDPDFATKNDFPQIDESILSWEYRHSKILEVVAELKPDIICMEEVKQNHAFDLPDYELIYLEKRALSHGLLVAYRKSIFTKIEYEHEFFRSEEEVYSQNFIYLKLKHISSDREINLVATHLKSKRFFEVRLTSVRQMIKFLETRNIRKDLLVCGDFNAEENEESIVTLASQMKLKSIREGIFTTMKMNRLNNMNMVKRKIDYIFYDPQSFRLINDWSLNEQVDNIPTGCPSKECPSDHLPLFATFELGTIHSDIKPNL